MTDPALTAIASPACVCGGPKDPGRALCRWCLFSLPDHLRGPLHKGLTQGLSEAYARSVEYLRSARGIQRGDKDGESHSSG